VVVIVGLWIAGVINKQHRLNNQSQPQPTATYAPTDAPTDVPTDAPTGGQTNEPFPTTKPTAPGRTAPTARPTRTTPPPPRRATPYELVSRNKFYRTGTQNSVGCRESSARATSLTNAVRYYAVVKTCADRGWPRQVLGGGWQFRVPKTIVMNGRVQSPCGGYTPSSYYCSANETIYMAGADDVAEYSRFRNSASGIAFNRAGMAFTMGHEYGHHVQQLTGILDAYSQLRYDATSDSAKLEVNRRMELQASCLAGVFLAANKGSYPIRGQLKTELDFVTNNSGDEYDPYGPRIHGNKKNHGFWFHRGYNLRNLAACNTFTAPSSQVA
jgi:predicted metalloprotease